MGNLLLINTPQLDYVITQEAANVEMNIIEHCLKDKDFMENVDVIGVVVDFYPLTNEHFQNNEMKCLSFTQGAGITERLSQNIHFEQTCAIKKFPKNDKVQYEKSVMNNWDSASALIEMMNPFNDGHMNNIYICGFSIDNSISSTVKYLTEFMIPDSIHIIEDLIWYENSNEKSMMDAIVSDKKLQTHCFLR